MGGPRINIHHIVILVRGRGQVNSRRRGGSWAAAAHGLKSRDYLVKMSWSWSYAFLGFPGLFGSSFGCAIELLFLTCLGRVEFVSGSMAFRA